MDKKKTPFPPGFPAGGKAGVVPDRSRPGSGLGRLLLLIAVFLVMSVRSASGQAPPAVILAPDSPVLSLDAGMALLIPPDEGVTVEDVLSVPATAFTIPGERAPAHFDMAVQWRLVSLRNPTERATVRLIEVGRPRLNYVDFYSVDEALRVTHYAAGSRRPFSVRPYPHRTFLFPVTVGAGETVRILLRTKSEGAIVVTAKAWEPDAFTAHSTRTAWYYGIMHGTALVLLLLAAVGAFSFRDRASFWLLIQVAGFHVRLLGLSGHLHEIVLPAHPLAADRLGDFATGPGLAGGFMFMVAFLDLRRRLPRIALLFQGLAVASVLLGATAFAGYYGLAAPVVNAGVLAYAFLSVGVLAYLVVRGERGLGLLCLGMAVPMAAMVMRIGKNFGLPVAADTAEWSIYVGFYGYAVILGVAIARHIRRIEEERLRLAHTALDETARRESILNRMVQERTQELEESQRMLMANLERERQSRQEQRNFLSMVSHEFKTPMSIILASVSTMSECRLDEAETAEEMGNIVTAVARMQGLVEKCLSDEWLDQASIVLDAAPLDLPALLRELLAAQRLTHEDRAFTLASHGTPRRVTGDDMLLRMMFANIIENAAKYSPPGTPIGVGIRWEDDRVQVFVQDQGEPIAPEDRARIFEKFYRSPRQRRKEGAGLGLYLVRRIARLHGGDIILDNHAATGNRFAVTLGDRAG
ncbi:sensor histidine kinase [Azospirillum fermentarium]|uniref:sensor histidine kinase n=1 Tax=Azospirillum fermentarium TaxID=1233114 RepID=UPI002227A138|nr:sensor histidine kinase [Azospirillum fermentarium]